MSDVQVEYLYSLAKYRLFMGFCVSGDLLQLLQSAEKKYIEARIKYLKFKVAVDGAKLEKRGRRMRVLLRRWRGKRYNNIKELDAKGFEELRSISWD